MLSTKDLGAIRRRTKAAPVLGLVAQHSQAVADRAALLAYIDALEAEIGKLGTSVSSALGASRILLGIKILEDGHAKNLGQAIDIAEDMDRVRALYPEPES